MALTPLLLALAAAAGNVTGAFAVVGSARRSLRLIETCLSFGAGFLIALVLLGVLPEVFAPGNDAGTAGLLLLAGYLLVHLAQHVITPHFHFGEETHHVTAAGGYSALVGLTLHSFFDGVAIASGFHVSWQLGVLFFLGVMLHKLPEGVTIASLLLASGEPRSRALWGGVVLGAATVLGAILTELAAPLARYGLALAAGVTLYVAASNLVPATQSARGVRTTAAFFGGVAALLLLRAMGGPGGG